MIMPQRVITPENPTCSAIRLMPEKSLLIESLKHRQISQINYFSCVSTTNREKFDYYLLVFDTSMNTFSFNINCYNHKLIEA
jgi:hypothetical protein